MKVVLCSRPRQNVKLGILISCRSRAATAKKCTKKRDARAKLLFCQSKAIAFLPFSLPSLSLLVKLPNAPAHASPIRYTYENLRRSAANIKRMILCILKPPICMTIQLQSDSTWGWGEGRNLCGRSTFLNW